MWPDERDVDVELRQLSEHVARVEDDVPLPAGPRDRHEMVMDDEHLDVVWLVELIADPLVVLAPDSTIVEVRLGRVHRYDRYARRSETLGPLGLEGETVPREALAEEALEVHPSHVAGVVVAGDDDLGERDGLEPPSRFLELPLVARPGQIAGDDHEVGLHRVDPLDDGAQEVAVESGLAAMDVADLRDAQRDPVDRRHPTPWIEAFERALAS